MEQKTPSLGDNQEPRDLPEQEKVPSVKNPKPIPTKFPDHDSEMVVSQAHGLGMKATPISNRPLNKSKYPCPFCEKSYSHYSSRSVHMKSCLNKKSLHKGHSKAQAKKMTHKCLRKMTEPSIWFGKGLDRDSKKFKTCTRERHVKTKNGSLKITVRCLSQLNVSCIGRVYIFGIIYSYLCFQKYVYHNVLYFAIFRFPHGTHWIRRSI